MAEPFLVCMTHGRAGRVATLKTIPGIPLCVAESQEPLYREHYPDAEYVVHPDSVVGISPKRMWLFEAMPEYENVMMFDDDLIGFYDMTTEVGEEGKIRDVERIRSIVEATFDTAKQMGAYLCGFSDIPEPRMYRPQEPFKLTGMISGCCLGLRRGGKLWFPDTPHCYTDDLWIAGINAYEHRFMLRDQRYAVGVRKTFADVGGLATMRTQAGIYRNEKMLKDAFGDAVYRRTASALTSLKNEVQLNLRVPW